MSLSKNKLEKCIFGGNRLKLCHNLNCLYCKEKSFANHPKSKYYLLDINKISPRYIFKASNSIFWFKCDKTDCGHKFTKALNMVTRPNMPVWCPYCVNQKLCDDNNCIVCFTKSLASHEKVKYYLLEKNNNIDPRTLFKSSNKKYWFRCDKNDKHIFDVSLDNMTLKNRWCPKCVNKTESDIYGYLIGKYANIKQQVEYNWCVNPYTLRYLPYDFSLEDYKIIIEVDGRQHFITTLNWTNLEVTRNRDIYKMKIALENGYTIIRIPQEDIQHNLRKWKEKLQLAIKKYEKPTIIYLTCEHLYKDFDLNKSYEKIYEKFKIEASEYKEYNKMERIKRSYYNVDIENEYINVKYEIEQYKINENIKGLEKKNLSNLRIKLNNLEMLIDNKEELLFKIINNTTNKMNKLRNEINVIDNDIIDTNINIINLIEKIKKYETIQINISKLINKRELVYNEIYNNI